MIQFAINEKSENLAKSYVHLMDTKGIVSRACASLDKVANGFHAGHLYEWVLKVKGQPTTYVSFSPTTVNRYIERIKLLYVPILSEKPTALTGEINGFETIIPRNHINCKIVVDGNYGNEQESLANRIVRAMKYSEARESVYPLVAKYINIKTCVYCNANYAISDVNGEGYYDLDHWKPKTLYPYLCVAFFNLQISCAPCNRRKSNSDLEFFQLWNDQIRKNREVFKFHLDKSNIMRYWITHLKEELNIKLENVDPHDVVLLNNTEDNLHISARYKEHRDVAEEMLWRAKVYNEAHWLSFENALHTLDITQGEKMRFLMGMYAQPGSIYLRPLAKMTLDVAKAVGLKIIV